MPMKPETKTTAKATSSEIRLPKITRLRMSRPRLSVPRACSAPSPCGACIIAPSCCLFGSCGARAGPRMPTKMKIAMIAPPVKALTCSCAANLAVRSGLGSVADARVNDSTENVDDQVDGDKGQSVGHYQPGDQRIVARVERGDQQA